jgi:tetraacyldisaccharide 4'-kinase
MTLLLAPLSLLYGSLVEARNARFDRIPAQRLRWPVVSVGNLSVGGAGKTPLVIRLAQLLAQDGWNPDVLSRGYGRSGKTPERVDAAGDATRFGDEPLLIARETGMPVYVGASRYEAGLLAEADGQPHLHLLDDGFQHRQLARTVDIVVMHRTDLTERLLPAGRLREPLSSLRRAHVVVLRQEDAEFEAAVRTHMRPEAHLWRVRRTLRVPPLKRALAFCAIARPSEFYAALTTAGVEVTERVSFRDHHRYTPADVERIVRLGKNCDAFVTTAKDAVKVDPSMRQKLTTAAPLHTATLAVEIEDEAAVLAQLRALLL